MTRVAVIGAGGQVGTAVVRRLARVAGFGTVAIVRNRVSAAHLADVAGCEIRTGEISKAADGARLLEGCQMAINCAYASGLPRTSLETNTRIIENAARAAGRDGTLRAFVQLSTIVVYGTCIHPSTGSTFEVPRPTAGYGRDKLHLEEVALRAFAPAGRCRLFIVRLGHVFGPDQAHTGIIASAARDSTFALPFRGMLPANAIHADRLAVQLASLLSSETPAGTFNGVEPERSWAFIFRWHTSALGLRPAAELDDKTSGVMQAELLRQEQVSRLARLGKDIVATVRGIPVDRLASADVVRDVTLDLLGRLPKPVEREIKKRYTLWRSGSQVRGLVGAPGKNISPYFFWEAAPGPSLPTGQLPLPSEAELTADLKQWYRRTGVEPWLRLAV